jgi:hypothetical protein
LAARDLTKWLYHLLQLLFVLEREGREGGETKERMRERERERENEGGGGREDISTTYVRYTIFKMKTNQLCVCVCVHMCMHACVSW